MQESYTDGSARRAQEAEDYAIALALQQATGMSAGCNACRAVCRETFGCERARYACAHCTCSSLRNTRTRPSSCFCLQEEQKATAGGRQNMAAVGGMQSMPFSPAAACSSRRCYVCGVTDSRQWRSGPRQATLCNSCGLKWQKVRAKPLPPTRSAAAVPQAADGQR